MNTKYRILFEIRYLHEYYVSGKCQDFEILPSAETTELLKNSRLLWKVVDDKLLVLVRVDDAGLPATTVPSDARLVFYLELNSPEFLTVTNLDNAGLRDRRFYFTNLNQNQSGGAPPPVFNLSKSIAAYDNSATYLPGDFVNAGGGAIFECIKTGSGQAPDAPGSEFWISRGRMQYAWKQDLLPFRSQVATFVLATPASSFRIRTFTLDSSSNLYDKLIREETVVVSESETSRTAQADLRSLAPGKYRININGEDFDAYIDEDALARSIFGVVEIFTHLPGSNAFSLVDVTGAVKEITYTVRFANRSAYWKYITRFHGVQDILISGAHADPSPFTSGSNDPSTPTQKDFFVSNRPFLLSESPTENLFDLKVGSDFSTAPKPDPRAPGMLTQDFDEATQTYRDFFCNIHINR